MADVGKWSFIIGLIVAVLAGFFAVPYIAIILLILGLIVGFLNVSKTEEQLYLVAVIAMLAIGVGGIQALSVLGVSLSGWVNAIFANFIAFVAASGLVVAVKTIIKSSKLT